MVDNEMKICPLCSGEVIYKYRLGYTQEGDADPTVYGECQECYVQW